MNRSARLERLTARILAGSVAFGLLYLLTDHLGANYRRKMTDAAVIGLVVLSLVVLTGLAGQVSFVQIELAGFGGLSAGYFVEKLHWNFWIALPVGVACAVVLGMVVAVPALRLKGLILGVVTLALAFMFDAFVFQLKPFTADDIKRPSLFGWHLKDDRSAFAFCLIVLIVCAVLVNNMRKGKTGRVFAAIRDSEVAARCAGINVTQYKLLAFGIASGLAGLAGVLSGLEVGRVANNSFTLLQSLQLAAVIVLMGAGYVASAFVGGVFIVWGPELLPKLHVPDKWFNVVLGALLIVQLLLSPDGVVALNRKLYGRMRDWFRTRRQGDVGSSWAADPALFPMAPPAGPSTADTADQPPLDIDEPVGVGS